jgi:hypothetical protein
MESKKIITGDYEDTTTGIRFLEDTEGRLHCMSCMWKPQESSTVTNNNETNNYYTVANPYQGKSPTVIQTAFMDNNWPSTNDFYRINNTYSGGYLGYTTSIDKELHITNIIASQGSTTLSILGLYKAGNLILSLPLFQEINMVFFEPIIIPPATYVELKFRPGTKKLSIAVCMIGYII